MTHGMDDLVTRLWLSSALDARNILDRWIEQLQRARRTEP